jgi:hypothetical protein
VVWYTGQFYALFFLTITLKVDFLTAYTLIAISLLLGTPFFVFFGWLSDRIGRLKIILAGCLVAVLTYFPLFQGLTHYVNPALETYAAKTPISVASSPAECNFHMFVGPWSTFTDCDRAKDFLTKQGLSFKSTDAVPGEKLVVKIGDKELKGAWDEKAATAALKDGQGDCEELSSLVIAICRASKIPARAVWIPGHAYPEFYLVDDHGKGHWFPCQAAGAERQFGSMSEDRPILQKGDNFTVPGDKPQRYVKQTLSAKDAAAPPEVKFIMERVKE